MKFFSYLLIAIQATTAIAALPPLKGPPPAEAVSQHYWQNFKLTHKRNYQSGEEGRRYETFKANLAKIAKLNASNNAANGHTPFGPNQFSDMSADEFKKTHLGFKPGSNQALLKNADVLRLPPMKALPPAFDWRDKGALTPVKDQGQCGSCWSFSATEELETAIFMSTGTLPPLLSTQQTNSCDTNDGGCNGGDTTMAYAYMKTYGVQTEASYPYTSGMTGMTGNCMYNQKNVVAHMNGYHYGIMPCSQSGDMNCNMQAKMEPMLQQMIVDRGPASICLNASTWQNYVGGVIAAADCPHDMNSMDHCVQLTGYGVDANGKAFWVLRNQWGTSFGDHGFLYLEMGKNTCGMANEVTYVDGANGPMPSPTPTPIPTPIPTPTSTPTGGLEQCHSCVITIP